MNKEVFNADEISRIAKFFRMGFYRTTQEGEFLECDAMAREVFEIPPDVEDLSTYSISKMYEIALERESRLNRLLREKGRPYSDTISIISGGKKKILFDVCWIDSEKNITGLVREMVESNLLQYIRAIENMPTGFYHVEYAENDPNHKKERLTQCNEVFAEILGFKNKEDAIGKNLVKLVHVYMDQGKNYLKDLEEAGKKNKALLNYLFKTKRLDNGKVIHISLDVHLVRDEKGNVIGREGTVRDFTELKELEDKIKKGQEDFRKTTEDIDKFIHRFLHPVVSFAGQSQLLNQVSGLLKDTILSEVPSIPEGQDVGIQLLEELRKLKEVLPGDENISYEQDNKADLLAISSLKDKIEIIINVFDHSLEEEESEILRNNTIRETALWILEEIKKANYAQNKALQDLIEKDFVGFLQGMLFDYLVTGTNILKSESEIMKQNVEALRAYIGLKRDRKYNFVKHDVRLILEENINRFRHILRTKGIEIEYKVSGNLEAQISPPDIDRVICNLLHNAHKYSHEGKFRTVKVVARELQPDNVIEISIENFGSPIKKEEIETGNIFKFGFRGELAYRSDRDGTGVGLADAKEIITAHRGKITITSMPSKDDGDPQEYKVPYITKVIIRLPKKLESIRG